MFESLRTMISGAILYVTAQIKLGQSNLLFQEKVIGKIWIRKMIQPFRPTNGALVNRNLESLTSQLEYLSSYFFFSLEGVMCRIPQYLSINQSIHFLLRQSNFYSGNIPGVARLSGATSKSVLNSKIDEAMY